jgi:hypothetical protein
LFIATASAVCLPHHIAPKSANDAAPPLDVDPLNLSQSRLLTR